MTTTEEAFGVAAFQRFLDQRRLVASRCAHCRALYVPPRPVCPQCHGMEMGLQDLSGRGRLAGFTAISVPPSHMLQEGFGRDNPYLTGVVALEEGPRVAARLVGLEASSPEKVKLGTRLTAVFQEGERDGQKRVVLAFQPATRPKGRG
ncbi:MAG: OB-fold domain-containing protein [Chloroflexi bacterium]|nr:OB-fold domain-containing protein [Chloroflexota bacterium]